MISPQHDLPKMYERLKSLYMRTAVETDTRKTKKLVMEIHRLLDSLNKSEKRAA
jgi:ferritin-like metal-binding protein YciE